MHRNKLRFEWTPLKADIGYQRPYTKQKKASRREDGANPEGRTSVTPVHHRLQFCRMVIFVFCLGCTALVALAFKYEYVYLDLSSSFCTSYNVLVSVFYCYSSTTMSKKEKGNVLVPQPIHSRAGFESQAGVSWSSALALLQAICPLVDMIQNYYDSQGVGLLVWLLLARYDSSPHQVTAAALQHDRLQIEL